MSKAILVMDMPESCSKCDFYGNNIHDKPICICQTEKIVEQMRTKDMYKRIYVNVRTEKPDWCPLRPMPEKKILKANMHDIQSMGEVIASASWNECIDSILGN